MEIGRNFNNIIQLSLTISTYCFIKREGYFLNILKNQIQLLSEFSIFHEIRTIRILNLRIILHFTKNCKI